MCFNCQGLGHIAYECPNQKVVSLVEEDEAKEEGVEKVAESNCKTGENSNFLKNGKMVISVKIQNFSKSQMTKRTSLLESSHEI